MRKKLLLFIITFILGLSNISAYTTTGDKCIDDRSCMVVCNYTNVGKSGQNAISSYYSSKYNTYVSNQYITIYYNYKSNNFAVGMWSGVSNVDGKRPYLKGPDSFDKVFSDIGTNVFVQPALNLNENTFKCPAHGYWDYDGWVGGNEVCFDSDGKWCATAKKNGGTRFGTSTSTFLSETRDMTFEDEIKYWFKNWSIGDIDIEDIKSGKYKTAEDMMEKIYLRDFRANYLNENKIPQFIKNSEAYQSGVALAKKQFEALKESWLEELEEEKNAGTLTEEEFNEIKKNLNSIDENFEEVGNDYSNRIDEIDVRPGTLAVTPIDICKNGTTSLKVFQVIGYILMLIKIIVPLILIILGSIDFGKAAMSGDDKAVKDAAVQFAKRVLIGLVIFFVPTVLDFFLSLVNGVSDTTVKFKDCTNCLFSPTNESRCSPGSLTVDETNNKSDNDGTNDDTNNNSKNDNTNNDDKSSTVDKYGYECYYEYKNAKGQVTSVGYNKNGNVTLIKHDGKNIDKVVSSSQNKGNSTYVTDKCYSFITVSIKELKQHSGYDISYKLGNTKDEVNMGTTNSPRTAKLVTD